MQQELPEAVKNGLAATMTGPLEEKLGQWGVRLLPVDPSQWDKIVGMDLEKQLITDKIVLPLQHPHLALKHGVSPPRAILLFGPPGTGKTSFSRGIAGKLGWSFVEVSPAELVVDGLHRQASRLRAIFELLLEVECAVIFFDEFEELALRPDKSSTSGRIVSSEMLKQIPRFHGKAQLLLICATNNIRLLNPALFEEEVATGQDRRVVTEDIVRAVQRHRATLSPEGLAEFRKDVQEFCRADYCRVLLGE